MTTRTTTDHITFRAPFVLAGMDEPLASGIYTVETDEESIEGISFPAYRRVATLLHVHPSRDRPGESRVLAIDPVALAEAVARDARSMDQPIDRADGVAPLEH